MDYRIAEFVRFVDNDESPAELIAEAKSDTWTKGREHAVIRVNLAGIERLVMVRGGFDGILLQEASSGSLYVVVDGIHATVMRLAWHTHPQPTGPSEHDQLLLEKLGQEHSMLYEIGGPREGTRFWPKKHGRP